MPDDVRKRAEYRETRSEAKRRISAIIQSATAILEDFWNWDIQQHCNCETTGISDIREMNASRPIGRAYLSNYCRDE
jgi:hypothetical protein